MIGIDGGLGRLQLEDSDGVTVGEWAATEPGPAPGGALTQSSPGPVSESEAASDRRGQSHEPVPRACRLRVIAGFAPPPVAACVAVVRRWRGSVGPLPLARRRPLSPPTLPVACVDARGLGEPSP